MTTAPQPHPAVAQLEPLIGRWRISVPGAPPGAGGDVEFDWLGDRAFVVQRWRSDPPEFPDGIAIMGPDETGEGFLQHYFDTRGVARRYGMSLRDGEWRLWRDDPDFAQRFIGRFSADGATIEGAWEIAMDRTTFEHDFDLTYRRVASERLALARLSYRAYETGDRSILDDLLADDFVFYAPPDPGIDRATYFERCWPNHGSHRSFQYERLEEISGDEVLVTYVAERTDGTRFRNTEVLKFAGDKLLRAEVYFGWNLD
jgi:ketosteroid isomerase-like protein